MDCKKCQDQILAYLEGELSVQEQKEMEALLEKCEECKQQLMQTRELLTSIDQIKPEDPDPRVRMRFLQDLEDQKGQIETRRQPRFSFYQIAASVALVIVGFAFGRFSQDSSSQLSELDGLKSEVQQMKQLVMVSMLKEESASERIQAVAYVNQFESPSNEVIETLFNTLNEDESPNVRLAAIDGLKRLTADDGVKLRLIQSLEYQTDPVVQIMLINLMVELEEKRAAKKFQQLIDNDATQEIVKNQARVGIELLI